MLSRSLLFFIIMFFMNFLNLFSLGKKSLFHHESLNETSHMFKWLHPDPFNEILNQIHDQLNEQVSGSKIISLKSVDKPEWLTGALRKEGEEGKAIVTRAGVAFKFNLIAQEPNGNSHNLVGVYTWIQNNMHDPKNLHQRIWFDINGKIENLGSNGLLAERIYTTN